MSEKKPITEKGLILYKDYEFIFNFLSREEIGEVVLTLLHTMDNPTLNPSDNDRVNNAYNYIANRIIDYKEKRDKSVKNGKKGGNPLFKRDTTLNPTLNPTLNGGDKLKENKIKENKIKDNKITNQEFDTFWEKYPRKLSKAEARTSFAKAITKTSLDTILTGLENYITHIAKEKTELRFIKHPSTWLNQECWADEYEAPQPKPNPNDLVEILKQKRRLGNDQAIC